MIKIKPSWLQYSLVAVIILCILAGYIYKVVTWTPVDSESKKATEAIIRQEVAKQLNINKIFNELTDADRVQIKAEVLSPRLRMIANRPTDEEIMNFLRTGGSAAAKFNKDPNNQIEPNSLTDENFATIIEFSITDKELTDIKLLEKFTNLQKLSIEGIKFPKKNIPSCMKILSKLGIYDLSDRFNIDLNPLENLSNLQSLLLASSQISNLEPIKELTNLQILYLVNTQISELEPLKEIKNLKAVYILNCPNITDEQVKDLQKALPNLKINR